MRTALMQVAALTKRIDSLQTAVMIDELTTSAITEPSFSVRESSLQHAGDGFEVGHLSLTSVPGGAKLTGMVLNTKSVTYRGITFKLNLGGRTASVWLAKLPAGGSANFSVTVEDVSASEVRYGTLTFDNATTSYQVPNKSSLAPGSRARSERGRP